MKLVKLRSNSRVWTKFQQSMTKYFTDSGCVYAIFTSTSTPIYATANEAMNVNAAGSAPMFNAKPNTCAKLTGRHAESFKTVLQFQCGSVYGYKYLGTIKQTGTNNTSSPSFAMQGNAQCSLGCSKSYATETLGLTTDDFFAEADYIELSLNSGINEAAIVEGSYNSTKAATASNDTSSNTAGAGVTTSATSLSAGNGYPYSIQVTPTFFYNITDHLETDLRSDFNSYISSSSASGINYKNLRNIFGAPYQFLPSTDGRIGNNYSNNLELAGYEFADKILAKMPLLFITPGNTCFMGGSTENARQYLLASWGDIEEEVKSKLSEFLEGYNGKLYTINPAYDEYFDYVNPMCRAGAIFLGIGDEELFENGKTLKNMHWGTNEGVAYEIYSEEDATLLVGEGADAEQEEEEEDILDVIEDVFEKAANAFNELQQAVYYKNVIPFYINSESSFQDSFSNETTESSLSSTINALSDKAREIQFLLGTASSAVGEAFDKVDGTLSSVKETINNIVKNISGGNTIFSTIANSVKTVVSGGRILFPQIWSNSTFSRSYNINIKLTTPSFDKISWWLNIYVPLCHLMALVLPRSEYVNSYTTPFIIKAFYKGMFNIDMGIITEMTFNKGKEGSWTKDALPTVVDVNITIQDLYSSMGMTSTGSMFVGMTLQNIAEMDYIANLCGININEPDVFRMIKLWATFNIENRISDFLPNLSLNLQTILSNTFTSAYESFWY